MTSELLEKIENQEGETGEEWSELFEQLLEDYDYENPRRGQILEGEIIHVDEDSVLVDIGAKRDAIVPRKDLDQLDDEFRSNLERGEKLPVYVIRTGKVGGDLLVSINRGLEQEDWERAARFLDSGEVSNPEIIGQNKGGVVVRFGRLRGFVPNSHIPDLRRGAGSDELRDQKEQLIGSTLPVKVIEVNQKRRRLVLSSRAARHERRAQRLEELEPGSTVSGKVVNLVDFGAFVDLGGVDGLVHISELDWSRVEHPSEVFEVGQEVEVEITDVDIERERVSLSRKSLLKNPWQTINETYEPGDLVEGEVTNVRNFGAFVMLPEGVEGLIHVSELGIVGPGYPQDIVHPGDKVLVRILDIEQERERISLSMSRVTKDEQMSWLERSQEEGLDSDEDEPMEDLPVEDFDAALEEELEGRPSVEAEAVESAPAALSEEDQEGSDLDAEAAAETDQPESTDSVEEQEAPQSGTDPAESDETD